MWWIMIWKTCACASPWSLFVDVSWVSSSWRIKMRAPVLLSGESQLPSSFLSPELSKQQLPPTTIWTQCVNLLSSRVTWTKHHRTIMKNDLLICSCLNTSPAHPRWWFLILFIEHQNPCYSQFFSSMHQTVFHFVLFLKISWNKNSSPPTNSLKSCTDVCF